MISTAPSEPGAGQVRWPKLFTNGYFLIRDIAAVGRHPECVCRMIHLFITHPMLKSGVGWVCDCEKTVLDFDLKHGENPERKKYL